MDSNSKEDTVTQFKEEYQKRKDANEPTDGAQKLMDLCSKTHAPNEDLQEELKKVHESWQIYKHDMQHVEYDLKQQLKEAKQEIELLKLAKKNADEALNEKYYIGQKGELLDFIHLRLELQEAMDKIQSQKLDIKELTCDNSRLYLTGESWKEDFRIKEEDFERKLKMANEKVENSTAILDMVMRDLELERKMRLEEEEKWKEEIQKLLKEKEELKTKSTIHKTAHLEVQKLLESTDIEFQKALTVIGRQELELEDLRRLRDELEDVGTPESKKLLNLTVYFHESRKKMIQMNADVNEGKIKIQNLEDVVESLRKKQKNLEKEHLEEVNELQMILEKQDDELEKLKMEIENSEDVGKLEDSGDSDGWRHLDDSSDGEALKDV